MLSTLYLVAKLPYRLQMGLGAGLGWLMYRVMPIRKHFAEVNIGLCFPELSEVKQAKLVRDHFDSFGKATIETAMAWWSSDRQLAKLVSIKGLEHLKSAQASGQGVLMLSAHFTTLELGGRLLALTQPFQVSYKAHKKKPLFNEVMLRARERRFQKAISSKQPRDMIKSLKGGNILWYAPDQDYGRKQSVFAPFFGVPAITLTSTARIVKMTNALVVPFYVQRLPNGQGYQLIIEPALSAFPAGDDLVDAAAINALIERWVRLVPEQYLWVHRRFKTRPVGEAKFYRPKKKKKQKLI
ncbi:MAG: LpxL/LpxP family Kdo(2)-lipid IV(A) lauroyl/palmitoleoyl acyltransferase [Methylococcales bacterium]|nr:LpxL/LpxP family Kdo(2)-lipid IV(A) lauroyl/palmitoleoyl acyltransferase [Methylococcales bacterium]MBT7443037.1 LpxL/LpxP family Kdo(2)-lipid IV(A) lauroyl/palmitoleoyl acyltransferase [Methylococcales bacterium]